MKKNIIISLIVILLFSFYIALISNISYFDNLLEEYIDSEVGDVRTEKTTKSTKEKKTTIKTTKKKKTTTTTKKTTTSTTSTTTTTKKPTTTTKVTTEPVTIPIEINPPHKVSTSRYLVGKWTTKTNGVKLTLTFLPNGTYYINNKSKTKYTYDKATIDGKFYIVSDNKLIIMDNYNDHKELRIFIKNQK